MTNLAGRRILITREADDSRRWAHRLTTAGALPIVFPCIMCETITAPETTARLSDALAECNWIVLSSVRGVEALAQLTESREPRAEYRFAVVGPSTAMAAKAKFGRVDLVASRAYGVHLGAELGARLAGTGSRVLIVGAEGGRSDVDEALVKAGVAFTRVDVYRTLPLPKVRPPRDLSADGVQDILLASPSAVFGLCNAAVVPPAAHIITIGPTTTSAARAAGLSVWAEARQPSLDAMLEALS